MRSAEARAEAEIVCRSQDKAHHRPDAARGRDGSRTLMAVQLSWAVQRAVQAAGLASTTPSGTANGHSSSFQMRGTGPFHPGTGGAVTLRRSTTGWISSAISG